MSQSIIFKVNKLTDKDAIETIYVFYGLQFSEEEDNLNDLFDDDPTNKAFVNVFNTNELEYIAKHKVEVIFINQSIHIDDSIGVIKLKIFEALSKKVSMSELYLYCLKYEKLNPITVYQNLTQNDKLPLTKIRIDQLLLNLYDNDGFIMDFNLKDKTQYTFDDILQLDLNEKTYLVGKPLGQKFVFSNEYPFIANPFLVTDYDTLLENSRKETSTLSSNLLLETGDIFRNNIYLCLAKDVFEMSNINNVSTEYTSKIYFPFLYQDQIEDLEELDTNRNKLIVSTTEKLTPDTERSFNNINMFYEIYHMKEPSELFSQNMKQTGIKFFKLSVYPDFKIKIPIDVIFKLIHATQEFPLIKYNPETRQENIYRLFAPELTADGRKIPYLQKAIIFKLMRLIGKTRSVAVYTNIQYNNHTLFMACEFEDTGVITIYPLSDFDNPILLSESNNRFENIDEIIRLTANPLIEQIKPFFEQSGLVIPFFESIENVNVEIRDMKYQTVYNISKPIDINKLGGCISSVFTIETSNFKKGIRMRYKRVSNFNKRDSQEAFIIEKIDQGYKLDEIIEQVTKQFDDLDEEYALDLISKIRSELEVIRGANKRRALMIKINPGFQTLMNIDLITSNLTVDVSGINDINYLKTIPIYIDSVIRITQDINSCGIDKSKINSFCSGEEVDDIEFGKITAQSEQSLDENQVPVIQDESPVYSAEQGEYMDDLLDMLGIDEDENELSDLEGGGESDSEEVSSKSVSSEVLSKSSSQEKEETKEETKEESKEKDELEEKEPEDIVFDDDIDFGSIEDISSNTLEKDEVNNEVDDEDLEPESVELSESSDKTKKSEKDEDLEPKLEEKSVELSESSDKTKKSEKDEDLEPELNEKSVELSESSDKTKKSEDEDLEPDLEDAIKASLERALEKDPSSSESIPMPEKYEPKKVIEEKEKEKDKKIASQNKIKAVGEKLENTVRDITGMKLQYPNPFSSRLEERMPELFVKSKNDKFDLYTRMCPFSLSDRRQPVILTKEERDKIVEEHPGEIDEDADFIEYGTDPKDSSKKFYYTCPRYWCLLTDTMVTEQDILDGKCGPKVDKVEDAVIPRENTTVPKGKYVYQFYGENERKYPGFHKKTTPSGLCLPCCYANWSTPAMKNRRNICQGKFDEKNAEKVPENEKKLEDQIKQRVEETEQYVKGPEKYGPQLGEHRWGFLPIVVQKFLHEVNEDCQVSKTNMSLKLHHTCILRHGVENSATQSFIACISSAVFFAQKEDKEYLIKKFIPTATSDVPTIKEMKQLLVKAIDLDRFIKYQNGDLVTNFADPDIKVNIDKYRNTKLYKKMITSTKSGVVKGLKESEMTTTSNIATVNFIIKVAQAFENFQKFLSNDKITIDYTYLWDLICTPNPRIFEAGINLIILEIPENDATNNIELVCPTNHYSIHTFDSRKRSLFLIKRENYFEPVYGYRNDGNTIHITKTFTEYDPMLPKTLRAVFSKIIKPTLGEKCRAFDKIGRSYPSKPNEYRFKMAPVLDKLIDELEHKKYTISVQILNFQGKVIGVLARNKKGLEGFIPCFPSALTNLKNKKCIKNVNESKEDIIQCDYDFVYMNDTIWKPYEQTLTFLKEYYEYEEPDDISKANCFNPKYFCKVVEDELITGFLTNTDQFIPIKDPIPVSNVDDTIKTITSNNMLVADINILTNNSVDSKRVDFIKRIQLETNFYNVFRNTIRILFNDYSNSEKRKSIKDECNKKYSLYKNQLDNVIEMLHELIGDTIIFASDTKMPYNYKNIDNKDIHTCVSQTNEKCTNTQNSICRMTNDKCQLVLPKNNLVNGTDNEAFYYGRMADELIRYNRIKSFIFKPQAYLSFGQIKYNLRDNEIIILQDLLTQEFFENLIPSEINRFAKYNTYDTAEPILSQQYNNELELDEIINPNHVRDCVKSEPNKIKSGFWRKCFPNSFREIEYTGSNFCSLYLIIDIVKEIKKKDLIVEQLKEDLIEIYSFLTDNFTNEDRINNIIDILKEEAQFDANQLLDGLTFEQMIRQDGFIAINFDLWLLLVNYKIPSIFISSKNIPETRFNANEFVCYTEPDVKEYVFILVPAMYRRNNNLLPEYKLIIDETTKNININIDVLDQESCIDNIEKALVDYNTVEDYLDIVFKKDIKTKYKPRKKGLREVPEFEFIDEPIKDDEPKKKVKKLKQSIILEEEPIKEIITMTMPLKQKSTQIKKQKVIQQKPIEEPIEELIEEPIENPIEKPIEEPIEELIEEPIEEPIENPIEKPIEEIITMTIPLKQKPKQTKKQKVIKQNPMPEIITMTIPLKPKIIKANPPGKRGSKNKQIQKEDIIEDK